MGTNIRINTDKLNDNIESIYHNSAEIENIAQRIVQCRQQMLFQFHSSDRLKMQLDQLYAQALANAVQMDTLAGALDSIVEAYIACENKITGNTSADHTRNGGEAQYAEESTKKRKWWQKIWDWFCDMFADIKPKRTSKEAEAAADAYMQQRVQSLLASSAYSEETWRNATPQEREAILNRFMNEVAAILGVNIVSSIDFFSRPAQNNRIVMGQYSHDDRTVHLNREVLSQSSASSYRLMSTVVHELRHAYQHAAVDNPSQYQVSQETINSWKRSFATYRSTDGFIASGLSPEDAFDAYRNQAVERDARWFAGQS